MTIKCQYLCWKFVVCDDLNWIKNIAKETGIWNNCQFSTLVSHRWSNHAIIHTAALHTTYSHCNYRNILVTSGPENFMTIFEERSNITNVWNFRLTSWLEARARPDHPRSCLKMRRKQEEEENLVGWKRRVVVIVNHLGFAHSGSDWHHGFNKPTMPRQQKNLPGRWMHSKN